jgi:predicted ATP-grasp superfamily ATP-dependent carboligase
MYDLCRKFGVPTPETVFPTSYDELADLGDRLTFPVVAKNVEPWGRLRAPVVPHTVVIADAAELAERFRATRDLTGLLLQEFIPHNASQDWFVALHADATSAPVVSFVGRKCWAWPVNSGVTADGRSTPNAELEALTGRFVRDLGWRGPASLDWRFDQRDGQYKLVDFNVRVGAQFRFGRTRHGLDVVRAAHLDLSGRPVPASTQDYAHRLKVGNLFLPSYVGTLAAGLPRSGPAPRGSRLERAWLAGDDPVPAAIMLTRGAAPVALSVLKAWREARRQRSAAKPLTASPTT